MRAALQICAQHWNPPARRCVGCPIERICSAPLQKPARMEDIKAHEARLEAAAVALENKSRENAKGPCASLRGAL